jgi:hypothetical protein
MVWDHIPKEEARIMAAVWAAQDARREEKAAKASQPSKAAPETSEKLLESPETPVLTSDEFRAHSLEELKMALRQPRGALTNVIGEHNWHRSTYSPRGQWVLKSGDHAINGHAELLRRDDEEGYDLRVKVTVVRKVAGDDHASNHKMLYAPGFGFQVGHHPICQLCLSRVILDHASGVKCGHDYQKCLFCTRHAKP